MNNLIASALSRYPSDIQLDEVAARAADLAGHARAASTLKAYRSGYRL